MDRIDRCVRLAVEKRMETRKRFRGDGDDSDCEPTGSASEDELLRKCGELFLSAAHS